MSSAALDDDELTAAGVAEVDFSAACDVKIPSDATGTTAYVSGVAEAAEGANTVSGTKGIVNVVYRFVNTKFFPGVDDAAGTSSVTNVLGLA